MLPVLACSPAQGVKGPLSRWSVRKTKQKKIAPGTPISGVPFTDPAVPEDRKNWNLFIHSFLHVFQGEELKNRLQVGAGAVCPGSRSPPAPREGPLSRAVGTQHQLSFACCVLLQRILPLEHSSPRRPYSLCLPALLSQPVCAFDRDPHSPLTHPPHGVSRVLPRCWGRGVLMMTECHFRKLFATNPASWKSSRLGCSELHPPRESDNSGPTDLAQHLNYVCETSVSGTEDQKR